MLIENNTYRRNDITGEILKRECVSVSCDNCKAQWKTAFDFVKRRRACGRGDYCRGCASKLGNKIAKCRESLNRRPINVCCFHCGSNVIRWSSQIKGNVYCNTQCRDAFVFEEKYGHLKQRFLEHHDAVCYLFGLILGDGHMKQSGKSTTRVDIAFDRKDRKSMCIAAKVLRVLRIRFYSQPADNGCTHFGFILPDMLLQEYGMFWHGQKYKAQPKTPKNITSNINFASGLINSDGCSSLTSRGERQYEKINFTNTVKSIALAYSECLTSNGIRFSSGERSPVRDKRTGNMTKRSWHINIDRLESQKALRSLCKWQIKDSRIM